MSAGQDPGKNDAEYARDHAVTVQTDVDLEPHQQRIGDLAVEKLLREHGRLAVLGCLPPFGGAVPLARADR